MISKVKKFLLGLSTLCVIFFYVFGGTLQTLWLLGNNTSFRAAALSGANGGSYSSGEKSFDSFREFYYYNLSDNFGNNEKGSCGYVAMGMLLSYYDTYLNDDIVPEKYDVASYTDNKDYTHCSSPGIKCDIIKEDDNLKYYEKLSARVDSSLHSKLISIGVSKNYCDIEKGDYSTTASKIINVLETYLTDTAGYTKDNQFKINSIESNSRTVRNFVIDKLKAGFPVLIGLSNGKGDNHACVAYNYDENADAIYCHFGNFGASYFVPEEKSYNYYKCAMVIDFNVPHKHSDNYKDYNDESISYCYCSEEACIYNHKERTENTNSTYHTISCACGNIYRTENHKYNSYIIIDELKHKLSCFCGADSKQERHTFVTVNSSSGPYRYCNKCFWSELKFEHLRIPPNISLEEYLLSLTS